MKLKDATVVYHRNLYTEAIEKAVNQVYGEYGLNPVCTSGNDSKHGKNSYHYQDRALDIRFWDILGVVAAKLKKVLPPYYDVVVEMDHIHIEADKVKEEAWIKNSSNT